MGGPAVYDGTGIPGPQKTVNQAQTEFLILGGRESTVSYVALA